VEILTPDIFTRATISAFRHQILVSEGLATRRKQARNVRLVSTQTA